MKLLDSIQQPSTLYATTWQSVGPGILVALMFVIVASAAMFREQSAVAGSADRKMRGGAIFDRELKGLNLGDNLAVSHGVQFQLPLAHLRDPNGRLTPNGDSLFRLLARRMKSLSLTSMLTAHSIEDAKFATTLATQMFREVSLEATQVRISFSPVSMAGAPACDPVLTLTITRHETLKGDAK